MHGDPDTSVLRDFVNGRLPLDQLPRIQEYLNANPNALERLESMEDDSFVKAFREGARVQATKPQQNEVSSKNSPSQIHPPIIANYRFVHQIKEHDLVSTWAAWLSPPTVLSTEMNPRRVIIKVFHRSRQTANEYLERFHREAETLRRLNHPHIVQYIDSNSTLTDSYLTMEYLDGIDLSRLILQQGTLPLDAVVAITTQILEGLNYLYEQNVIHRDIKPSNIMLCSDGVVRLIDFGLARPCYDGTDNSVTRSEQFLGTIDYISPEQAMEPTSADIRSDLYSLGCTLYRLLTGYAPFSNRNLDNPLKKVVAHAIAQPPKLKNLRQDLPEDFCDCIEKFLAKNPANRYQTPTEAIAALAPWYDPNSVTALIPAIEPIVEKRQASLWNNAPGDLQSQWSAPYQATVHNKKRLFIAIGAITAFLGSIYFLSQSWFPNLPAIPKVDTQSLGEQQEKPLFLSLTNPSAKNGGKPYIREGYYVGTERNLRNKSEQRAGFIISDEALTYTTIDDAPPGQLRRLGCLWTRIHDHELETQGKVIYVEQPEKSGYLILEILSETEFKATCWRGSTFTLAEAIQDPSVSYFHSSMEAKWWSPDTLFVGPAMQLNQEIANDWPTFLSRYAPRCVPSEKRPKSP